MKKLTAILGAIALSATVLVGCGGGKYKDGTYTG
ncbi:FMN-binding protein, partial [Clostridium perfringens]|nr:FMN-binding protein [Clostridium perfringens]